MFRGRYEHAIDAKGRTSLPSRFRDELLAKGDSRISMTVSLDDQGRFIKVYPSDEWRKFEAKLLEFSPFDPQAAIARRIGFGDCNECDFDKLGRVLIPGTLREHARITRDVVWVGVGHAMELWDKLEYEQFRMRVFGDIEQLRTISQHLLAAEGKS